jgi:hypothetical protein
VPWTVKTAFSKRESDEDPQVVTVPPVLRIDIARARRSRRVLFVGNPTRYVEVSYWSMVKQWMVVRGLEPVRNPDGDVLCVVVTEDVLDGVCSTKDAETIERLRGRGVPVISVHATTQIWRATARVRARPAGSGWRHSSSHHRGA